MKSPNEKDFQSSLVTFFKNNLDYEYKRNTDLFDENLRVTNKDYLLKPILKECLQQINANKTEQQINDAIFEIEKITDKDLVIGNKNFYHLIKNGIDTYHQERKQHEKVFLFNFQNPHDNHFLVVDEFQFTGAKNKRVDVVIFVNGIAVSVIELKSPTDENVNIEDAFNQIKNYQNDIQDLFITNCFNSISNMYFSKAGTITANLERYIEFKDELKQAKWENHFKGLYSKDHLIKIVDNFLIFTNDNQKILCAYHQFYAVEKLIQKSLKAYDETNQQVGVIWHTTGSGKSFTMTFYVKQLLEKLKPLVIVLTDRIDLDDQLFNTFSKSKEFLNVNQGLLKIDSRKDLIDKIQGNTKSNIIFTTIQKFSKAEDRLEFEELSKREDIFIVVDEAHRTQYGLQDGLARHLRKALPNAKFIAFTGTPIELVGKNTKLIFGDYIDQYTISDAVADKTTVPIHYEARLAKIGLKKEQLPTIDKEAQELFNEAGISEEKAQKRLKIEAIIGSEERLKRIAQDFFKHYKERQKDSEGKVMFCCFSRKVAVAFYEILISLKPESKDRIKVIFSGSSSDNPEYQEHIRTKKEIKNIEKQFKNPDDGFSIAIVVDMWQTGFDVPCLNTLYIDKPLKEHTLIQTISRVNRVYEDKTSGLIVDYIGIGEFLKQALSQYSKRDQQEIEIDFEQVIKLLMEKYELTRSYFKDFDYSKFLKVPNRVKRLEVVRDGVDFILAKTKNEQQNFLLNTLELIKAYALCPLSDEAKKVVDEINYFKCVRSGVLQFSPKEKSKSKVNLDKELSQLVSSAIEDKGVVNIFDFAGVKNPKIDILNEDFFNKIKNLKQKNLAFELLKKLLNDKIKTLTKGNITLEKKFSEKLQNLVAQYHNKTLTSAEVIEELIKTAKELQSEPDKIKSLGLSEDEIKFYYAVAKVNDAKQVMDIEILKELAKDLVKQIRKNKTIDWDKKESTRATMRLMIKKLLKKYKYPPEGMEAARDLVLEQAKVFCEEL